jgi:hypothetical protein
MPRRAGPHEERGEIPAESRTLRSCEQDPDGTSIAEEAIDVQVHTDESTAMSRSSNLPSPPSFIPARGPRARIDEHAAAIAAALGLDPAPLADGIVDRLRRALIEATADGTHEWRTVTLAERLAAAPVATLAAEPVATLAAGPGLLDGPLPGGGAVVEAPCA